MFTRILVPVDGSDPRSPAAAVGLELAAASDATVDALYVPESDADADGEHDPLREAADDGTAPPVETHRAEGKIHEAIEDHLSGDGVDLVVMDRQGRSGLAERLLGGPAERVLREAGVPVLVVPEDAPTDRPYDDVLLTTDGSEIAAEAVPHAVDLARRLGATLHVVTVVDIEAEAGAFDAGGVPQDYIEQQRAEARDALERTADRIDAPDLDVRTEVVEGRVPAGVDDYAAEHGVDLILMASESGTRLLGQKVGSVTRRVVRTTDRPVLVVPASG